MAGLHIEHSLRPCYVITYKRDPKSKRLEKDTKIKALFHCWEQMSDVVSPSPMVGGHNGGIIAGLAGIVEREDGTIGRVRPEDIQFCDHKFNEYSFPEEVINDEK